MRNPVTLGSISLGVLIGSLVRTVVFQTPTVNVETVAALVGIIAGAAVLGIFKAFSSDKLPEQVYYYPVGLLIGYAGTTILEFVLAPYYKHP